MEADAGQATAQLRVDGGASQSDYLMQVQSDLFAFDIVRPRITETTALGAAYLAGLAVGFWQSTDELRAQWQADKVFSPQLPPEQDAPLHAALRRQLPDDEADRAISLVHHYPFIHDPQPAALRAIVFFWEETSVPADTIAHLNGQIQVVG